MYTSYSNKHRSTPSIVFGSHASLHIAFLCIMARTPVLAMLMWRIHFVRATMLRSIVDQHSVLFKFDIPDEINPIEVNVWFFSCTMK